jgi:hypothetical protein
MLPPILHNGQSIFLTSAGKQYRKNLTSGWLVFAWWIYLPYLYRTFTVPLPFLYPPGKNRFRNFIADIKL